MQDKKYLATIVPLGRIIKERHERREENHSERGELISTDVIETITNRMVFNILTPTGFRSLV